MLTKLLPDHMESPDGFVADEQTGKSASTRTVRYCGNERRDVIFRTSLGELLGEL